MDGIVCKDADGIVCKDADGIVCKDAEDSVRKRRFNTSMLVGSEGDVLLRYRKVHLLGHAEYDPKRRVQHLEKRYFEVGDLGFPVIRAPMGGLDGINMGMLICNDRRWPEAWRVLGLQSVELVALGNNTPSLNMEAEGFEAHHLRVFHSHLSIQAGCYQKACFAVAAAKAGFEDVHELFERRFSRSTGTGGARLTGRITGQVGAVQPPVWKRSVSR